MENVLLLQYNNYANRILKRELTIQEYVGKAKFATYYKDPVMFNPNDGVTTTQILNWDEKWNPDYLIIIDKENNIMSRWFITEQTRLRGFQYRFSLKRDTVADNFDIIKDSPIFLERGTVKDYNDHFIYNSEDFPCNQIKKGEILLYDNTKTSWLVLYLAKNAFGQNKSGTFSTNYEADYEYTSKEDFLPYHNYGEGKNTPMKVWKNIKFQTIANNGAVLAMNWKEYVFNIEYNSNEAKYGYLTELGVGLSNLKYNNQKGANSVLNDLFLKYMDNLPILANSVESYFGYKDNNDLSSLLSYRGKIIYISGESKYYRVNVTRKSDSNKVSSVTSTESDLYDYMKNYFNQSSGIEETQNPNNSALEVDVDFSRYEVVLEDITVEVGITWTLSDVTAQTDSPLYDVVCLPYGSISYEINDETVVIDRDFSLAAFNSITRTLTKDFVYDYQIIPYCPIPNFVEIKNDVPVINAPEIGAKISFKNGDSEEIGCAIVVPSIKIDDVLIDVPIEKPARFKNYNDVYNIKLLNDCYKYRICSPNYNGLFEFNLAKNNSECPFFNLDMTLKPQMPYIHLNPNFAGLYGRDYNDARGLICGGDFSIGIINDAWQVYEIQNKNYQNIFDRQIQNMDTNYAIQQLGTAMAGIGSAAVGILNPNPVGTLAGGAGAVGSIVGLATNALKHEEQRDYASDIHQYQLQNIQALPYSITKSTPLTNNNKLVPFVEIYECSNEEKQAYMDHLTYDGMNIGKITTISQYSGGFIKGKIIRLEGINDDSHINNDIYNELSKGVYVYE